jgi:ATP phosphoribosyltransferase regulatory subunit
LFNKEEEMETIRLPQGMRDLMSSECRKKELLQKRIEHVFSSFGYKAVSTPAIEYYETYQNGFSAADGREMYKFFDQEGRILTLRVDMTVPIARVCASKFANERPPFRFQYSSDVFKVRHTFAGKRSEVTDCGIELIGLDEASDIEILYTAVQVMNTLGVSVWKLDLGNSRFFSKACEELGLEKEETGILADLIDRKSLVDLDSYVKQLSLSESAERFFTEIPMLTGEQDALKEAGRISFTKELEDEVKRMQQLYKDLDKLGAAANVSFDFGKVPHLDYYTGIIFEGYADGVGTSVLSGGRYDSLLARFGRDLPACGFSVKLDLLLDVLNIPEENTVQLMYPYSQETDAILKSAELRKNGYAVEMIPWDKDSMEVKK